MQTFEQHIVEIMLKERKFIDQFKKHYSILVNIKESNECDYIFALSTHAKLIEHDDNVKLN